jgi:hypothetical protein
MATVINPSKERKLMAVVNPPIGRILGHAALIKSPPLSHVSSQAKILVA